MSNGTDARRSSLERGTRLLLRQRTSADPEERVRAASALYAAENAGPLLDRLASRLLPARKRAKGEPQDRTPASLRLVPALSLRARARPLTWSARDDTQPTRTSDLVGLPPPGS